MILDIREWSLNYATIAWGSDSWMVFQLSGNRLSASRDEFLMISIFQSWNSRTTTFGQLFKFKCLNFTFTSIDKNHFLVDLCDHVNVRDYSQVKWRVKIKIHYHILYFIRFKLFLVIYLTFFILNSRNIFSS